MKRTLCVAAVLSLLVAGYPQGAGAGQPGPGGPGPAASAPGQDRDRDGRATSGHSGQPGGPKGGARPGAGDARHMGERHDGPDRGRGKGPPHQALSAADARRMAQRGGWTGHAPLPPTMVKNLHRGRPLLPEMIRRPLPPTMARELPVYPGYEWVALGRDLVLISVGTAVVVEILQGVFE